jgi:hypothetical protein
MHSRPGCQNRQVLNRVLISRELAEPKGQTHGLGPEEIWILLLGK